MARGEGEEEMREEELKEERERLKDCFYFRSDDSQGTSSDYWIKRQP